VFRGNIGFKNDCQPRTDIVKVEKENFVAVPQYFSQVEEPFMLAMGLMMLGRQKCTQHSH
jgi:hypothetical protein